MTHLGKQYDSVRAASPFLPIIATFEDFVKLALPLIRHLGPFISNDPILLVKVRYCMLWWVTFLFVCEIAFLVWSYHDIISSIMLNPQVTRVVGHYVSGVTGPGNDHTSPTVTFPHLNEVELFASNVLLPSFALIDCNPGMVWHGSFINILYRARTLKCLQPIRLFEALSCSLS